MKRTNNIAIFLALLLLWSCSANVNSDSGEYSPPSIKSQPRLIFPISAQEKGIEGVAKALISVSDEGAVQNVRISESSGYNDLDAAALSYCKKLLFFPAKKGDINVPSFVKLKVIFDYQNNPENSDYYVRSVLSLYDRINSTTEAEKKRLLQKELFDKHVEFVRQMGGEIRFNYFAKQVIQEKSLPEWGDIWDSYPLTFLLFHDFIQRYPDCEFLPKVKAQLVESLKNDIYLIENSPAFGEKEQNLKEGLLLKIKSFVSKHYPKVKLSFKTDEISA
ncbi:MAG: energy transducer TonB [Chlorobi bacterium]|nr:energy transducer TonB [Chlorobiota bacterium]